MTKELTLNKVAAGLVGVAMMAGLAFAFAAERAHAITLSELVELFIALEVIPEDKADEARAVLTGQDEAPAASSMTCNFTRNLSVGDTGADVMDLQKLLNGKGFTVAASGAGSAGMESEYYGQKTAGAVAAMQEAFASEILAPLGLTAGTGYFGASTRAKANSLCAAAPTTPTVPSLPDDEDDEDMMDDDDDDLSGGEASYGAFTRSSTPSSVEVSEGDEEVEVAGFEFDVDDADSSLKRVYVSFEETSAAANSVDPWDYFEEIQLFVNGDMVATENADDEDDWEDVSGSNRYEMRFTGLSEKLEADEEANITIGVTVHNTLDSADEDAVWTVSVREGDLRVRDGAGIDETLGSNSSTRDFSLEAAGQGEELKIRSDSSNPDSSIIKVDDTDSTDDVVILVFKLEAKDTDVEIREFPIELLTSDNSIDDVVSDVKFEVDGVSMGDVSSAGVGTTTTFEFDNNDFIIDEGDSVQVKIVVDLKDTSDYAEGTTIEANVSSTQRDAIVAEGTEDFGTSDMTGTANGDAHQLLSEGVFAEIVSTDASKDGQDGNANDKATFKLKFDVTAFDDDFYVPFGAETSHTSLGVVYHVETDAGVATSGGSFVAGLSNTSGAGTEGNFWLIQDGETETFELTVTYTPTDDGTFRAQLDSVYYTAATSTAATAHTAAPAEDFETGTVQISDAY